MTEENSNASVPIEPRNSFTDWSAVHRRLEETAHNLEHHLSRKKDVSQILKSRAQALAARPSTAETFSDRAEVFVFYLGQTAYAVPANAVREVIGEREITSLPGTPAHLLGLINVRSRILPVIDLRRFFAFAAAPDEEAGQLLIIDRNDTQFAFRTDEAAGLQHASVDDSEKLRLTARSLNPDYIQAVTTDGTVVLDLDTLIRDLTLDEDVDL